MDKIIFKQHLDEATTMLVDFTKELCYNNIADRYKYRITPNSRIVDKDNEYLIGSEIAILKVWNKYENQTLCVEQVVDLLHHNNKVPVWIDTTIYEARQDLTIINLLCSRRLRGDRELYHQGQIMPFHLLVAMPSDHLKIEKDGKFDVNWKKRLDDKKKPKNILTGLKHFFKLD